MPDVPVTHPEGAGTTIPLGPAPAVVSGLEVAPHPVEGQAADVAGLLVVEAEHYTLEGEVARGGIGRVFLATDHRLDRPVAIKQLIVQDDERVARFEHEARVTASLQHPGIVSLYEAGQWETGEPFFAMKMVSGARSLADAIAKTQGLHDRLALLPTMLAVADAMAYAHDQRIVHLDLEPENVLLGPFGETVVIDWGLARKLPGDADAATARQASPFVAPEQARGKPVDAHTDVFSLGAMLYNALTGERPSSARVTRRVMRKLVARPSGAASAPRSWIPPELVTIVEKAMAREPEQRYASAKELAEDLRRYQTGRLVEAHRYTAIQLLRRFLSRHRAVASVAAVSLLLIVTALTVTFRQTMTARRHALEERERAVRRTDELSLVQARSALQREPASTLAHLAGLSPDSTLWSSARIIAADAISRGIPKVLRGHEAAVLSTEFSADGRLLVSASADRSVRVWDLDAGKVATLGGHQGYVNQAVFSPDGMTIASASNDATVRLWDARSGKAVRVLRGHNGRVSCVTFSPDGTILASGGDDGAILFWDRNGESRQDLTGHRGAIRHLAFSRDGSLLASAGAEGAVRIWDGKTGELRAAYEHRAGVSRVVFSADGSLLASGGDDHAVRLWDIGSGTGRLLGEHAARVTDVAFVDDPQSVHQTVISSGDDGALKLWDLATGKARDMTGHEGGISRVARRPGGVIATAGRDGSVRLWDLDRGEIRAFRGHDLWVYGVVFAPDGARLTSFGADKTIRVWNVAPTHMVLEGHEGWVTDISFWGDGSTLSSLGNDNTVRLWNVRSGKPRAVRELPEAMVGVSPDGSWFASASIDGSLRASRFRADTTTESWMLRGHEGEVLFATFSRDGKRLATAGTDKKVIWWGLPSGEPHPLPAREGEVLSLQLSPDGDKLAVGGDGTVDLFTLSASTHRVLRGHDGAVLQIAFSPDGKRMATASPDMTARVWDLERGTSSVLRGHEGGVTHVAFAPDGKTLATCSTDKMVRLWDLVTGEARVLRGHEDMVGFVAFSPDGGTLGSASSDRTARLWDVATGESRVLRGHLDRVLCLAFSPDGKTVATAGKDGTVRLFADDLPKDPAELRAQLQQLAESPLAYQRK